MHADQVACRGHWRLRGMSQKHRSRVCSTTCSRLSEVVGVTLTDTRQQAWRTPNQEAGSHVASASSTCSARASAALMHITCRTCAMHAIGRACMARLHRWLHWQSSPDMARSSTQSSVNSWKRTAKSPHSVTTKNLYSRKANGCIHPDRHPAVGQGLATQALHGLSRQCRWNHQAFT